LTKRGELDAEVDDPYRAANIAKLLESWMPPSVASTTSIGPSANPTSLQGFVSARSVPAAQRRAL
jgi:hypothetical protein